MKKWEYIYFQTEYHLDGFYYTAATDREVIFKTEDKAQIEEIYLFLNYLGAEGWEMLAVNCDNKLNIVGYYFKRPVQ